MIIIIIIIIIITSIMIMIMIMIMIIDICVYFRCLSYIIRQTSRPVAPSTGSRSRSASWVRRPTTASRAPSGD